MPTITDFSGLIDRFGASNVLAAAGLLTGLLFGFMAQRSRFCLRAAAIEFWSGRMGARLVVWLLAFMAAVVAVQAAIVAGQLDVSQARQLSARGSVSGALLGGLIFGAGMVMTRGCASRILILSAQGNLRALLSGLVFAVTAQATLSGSLAPWREAISAWWTVEGGGSRDLLAWAGLGHGAALALAFLGLAVALGLGWRAQRSGDMNLWAWLGGLGVGLSVAFAWWVSYQISEQSFGAVPIQGVTFSGPSAEWLMRVLDSPAPAVGFGFGLMPGVFLGSLLGALLGREWKLEGFQGGSSMPRYIVGAMLMGFGSMLAGGCAVGAGVTGGAVFALTAWLTLFAIWASAGLTKRWLDPKLVP